MRLLASLLLICNAPLLLAAPTPPSLETVSEWITFSKPVTLTSEPIKPADYMQGSKPIWLIRYVAREQTLTGYIFGLYERGSLFGERRSQLEAQITKAAKELEATGNRKFFRVETRPD